MSITTSDCVESIWFKWGHFSAAKLESRVAKYVYHSFVHRSAKSERKQVTKKSEKGEFFRDGQRGNKSFFSWIECHFPAASSQHIMKNKLTQTQCKMKNGSKYRISAKNIWPSQTLNLASKTCKAEILRNVFFWFVSSETFIQSLKIKMYA